MNQGSKIRYEKCSRLGQAILDYMEQHSISMREMAKEVDITHTGLRACCWHKANPTESTLRKLSKVLNVSAEKLLSWVIEDRIRNTYEAGAADFLLQAIEDIIKVLRIVADNYPEDQRPSDYQLVRQGLESLNPFGVKKRVAEEQEHDGFQVRSQTTPLTFGASDSLGVRTQERLPQPLHR